MMASSETWFALAALLDPVDSPSSVPPDLPDSSWRDVYALATETLVAPSLHAMLDRRGWLHLPPLPVQEALEAIHGLNRLRNSRLAEVLLQACRTLNEVDIVPVALKGAIALLPASHPLGEARMMHDLDLGMPPGQAERAAEALLARGFRPLENVEPAWYAKSHHLVPLVDPSKTCRVEIHRRLLSRRVPEAAVCLEEVLSAASRLEWRGAAVSVPTLEHRLVHNALHQQVQNRAFDRHRLSLRQLLEFAQLRAVPGAKDVDWTAWLRRLDAVDCGHALRGYLLAASWLFGHALPDGVDVTPAARRAMRRVAWRRRHPRTEAVMERWVWLRTRLLALPRLLMTPSWRRAKYRSLRRRWTDR